MNSIKNFFKMMAAKTAAWTSYDDETARLMGEMDAMVANLEWPIW